MDCQPATDHGFSIVLFHSLAFRDPTALFKANKGLMPTLQTTRRVLILDDEQLIANTLALILNRNGFEARAVYNAKEAIETAAELSPDVLISDVIMEGMTGIEAAIRISELVPKCRIILFSGQAATADLLERAEANGHHFEIIAKPIHPRLLLDWLSSSESAGV